MGSTWRPSLGEAPAPAQWLNLPRLTQPLPGMGGGVVHEGRGKSGQGWGRGTRKGESQPGRQDGPEVSTSEECPPPPRRLEGGTGGARSAKKDSRAA